MTNKTYDDFSQDYDKFVNWDSRLAAELPFIEKLLSELKTGGNQASYVLDAACGTGMHAIALAGRGYRAAGADISEGMVAVAQENARKAGAHVTFKATGFGGLEQAFKEEKDFPFDLLICLGNSLPHLTHENDLKSALSDFAACLKPGGLLLLQNRNYDAVMANQERWIGPQSHLEGNKEWLFFRFYDFDADGLITFNIVRLRREGQNPWTQEISSVRLFPLTQERLLPMLETSGFDVVRMYGFLGETPFDPLHSENLVVVAQKA
jgi:SAM-dependent methyltransferase